jgi:hypothetical protein
MAFEIIRTVDDPLYDRVFKYATGGPIAKTYSPWHSPWNGLSPSFAIYDEVKDFKFTLTGVKDFLAEDSVTGPKDAYVTFTGTLDA